MTQRSSKPPNQYAKDLDPSGTGTSPDKGSMEPIDRGYGDEHGGYVVKPTEGEPRRPAVNPDDPDEAGAPETDTA